MTDQLRIAIPLFDRVTALDAIGPYEVYEDELMAQKTAFEAFVDDLAGLTRPGAPWVLQFVNWDYLLTRGSYRFPDVAIDGGAVVFERRYPEITPSSVEFATRLVRGETVLFEGAVTLHPLTFEDCITIHDDRGFALVESFGNFRGSEFEPGEMSSSIHVFGRI